MKITKHTQRLRRAKRTREHIKRLGIEKGTYRLTIHRTLQHIYAQIIAPVGGKIIASASSLDAELKNAGMKDAEGKIGVSKLVGALVAQRAKAAGVERVACDRGGFKYHGRVAAVVDAARENGLVV